MTLDSHLFLVLYYRIVTSSSSLVVDGASALSKVRWHKEGSCFCIQEAREGTALPTREVKKEPRRWEEEEYLG